MPFLNLFQDGNAYFNSGDYANAFRNYFIACEKIPALLNEFERNIRIFRSRSINHNHINRYDVGILSANIHDSNSNKRIVDLLKLYEKNKISLEISNIESRKVSDLSISLLEDFSVRHFEFEDLDSIDLSILQFTLQRRYEVIHVINPTHFNLLLASLYKLIFGTKVIIDISNRKIFRSKELLDLINEFDQVTVPDETYQLEIGGMVLSDSIHLDQLLNRNFKKNATLDTSFRLVYPVILSLLKYLKNPTQNIEITDIKDPADLIQTRSSMGDIEFYKEVLSRLNFSKLDQSQLSTVLASQLSESDFISKLFQIVLKRTPEVHELSHYSHLLISKSNSPRDITNIVTSGEECTRLYRDDKLRFLTKKSFELPNLALLSPDDISIPYYSNPIVSVLIPVFCKLEYTLHCLKSIEKHLPAIPFEIIILDDFSPDNSASELEKIKNIKVVRNPINLGFTLSCNYGSQFASGEYLHFLNNDIEVKSGWLDELVHTFQIFPSCGLAGSKLIYPDGVLQEAGCIIWQDGSAWNYGREMDPNSPDYNYAREVDYCSGASMLIKKALFFELGCFDKQFAPAYCEDSDLALSVRNEGYSVIYQPLSEVIHYEGVSHGIHLDSGLKKYQVENMKKQFKKWKHVLSTHQKSGVDPHLERNRGALGNLLFIDACTPTPDQDSGSVDILNIMIMLRSLGYAVTFIPEDNFAHFGKYTKTLQRHGIQAIYHPYCSNIGDHLREFGDHYDLVMILRSNVASKCLKIVQELAKSARVIFNTVDLHFLRLEREAAIKNDSLIAAESHRVKKLELDLMRRVDISIVISDYEMNLLKEIDPSLKVFHLPYSRVIAKKVNPFEGRDGILFVGGFQHTPNVDAVNYFVLEILPIVLKDLPNAKFHIVGSNIPEKIKKLENSNIVVHGYVEDLSDLMGSVIVNIVPLRYGAGIKGKLGGAMAFGLPSISTSIGIEGMKITSNDCGVVLADLPDEFARKIIDLHHDGKLWKKLSAQGLAFSENHFGLSRLHTNLLNLFESVGIQPIRDKALSTPTSKSFEV